MAETNFQKAMECALLTIPRETKLLLHSCCGPCSSAVLEILAQHFSITLYFYNPNIWPQAEYERRRAEQISLLKRLPLPAVVEFAQEEYIPADFYEAARGLEDEPEGGLRCAACFTLRLRHAAQYAAQRGIGLYTTTLTLSPHKNAALLNQLGAAIGKQEGVEFLPSDFKKKNGYHRSLTLSGAYGLYRQEYCGCAFSHHSRFGE